MTLFDLFAAYFNQDWMIDDATPADVVARFLGDAPLDDVARTALANEIDAFAARFADDVSLERALFKELGCYYLPSADGLTARAWLAGIASQIKTGRPPA